VQLPGGDLVVTASNKGKVRVFAVATGTLERELDAHEGSFGWRVLAGLGGDIFVAGRDDDGKVVIWKVASGEWLGEAVAVCCAGAVAALEIYSLSRARAAATSRSAPRRAQHGGGGSHRGRAKSMGPRF
jgi:WD40 repeat protein